MKNQNPIHVFATWKVIEGQIENVLNLLKTVHDESVKENGNLFYTIHQSIADPNTLLLFEGYTSEEAVTEHRNSAYFQEIVLGQIVPLLQNREIVLATPVAYL
ncbi:putative quinol monooxygenase [Flavobacterium hungaricum]|uniref:Antibiotic biosynthesis monooxygenase n=1 Tax=Flavobacterium hungaricum TaxID=2082725 RepID=A0ABR9TGF4_9FLAO|nr:putative quinol monooxygenase [Flavobacterium hungaricum]MBE8724441.1 antibiotic biosynthesis monooxygenase [Flavobacterium hungaricum]